MTPALPGPDGGLRCPWALSAPDNLAYHDTEWGRPVHGDVALFERFALEAFQSGLSWLTILRKREGFRAAFAGFDPEIVARFGEDDRQRLLADASIVRNRAKIEATIANAGAVLRLRAELEGGLDAIVWSFAAEPGSPDAAGPPQDTSQIPSRSAASVALAKELKRRGFVFVGPTTAYAALQACGVVNDHLVECVAREAAR